MIEEIFQNAESVRSGQSHVTSQPVSFLPHPDPGGILSRSLGMPSRNDRPPDIWDTHGILGNVFANPTASSSAPSAGIHGVLICRNQFTHQRRRRMRIKHQFRTRDASQDLKPEIQSSPGREILQRIMGQTNNDCRSQIFILTNPPRQQRSLVGR